MPPTLRERLARFSLSSRIDFSEHEDKILMLLATVLSAIVGLVIVAFVVVTEHYGAQLVSAGPAQRFFTPLIGSLIAGWLCFRFFPDARGSGIPQTRVALILHDGFISLRSLLGKFLCSSISLGSGIALGREGPSVFLGAGVASVVVRWLGLSPTIVRSLIPVGTAAAVAAAFNTPLAAVLFTLEEILADLNARVVGTVVIGAATSWMVLRLILGDEPLFHVPAYQLVHPLEFVLYALLGLAGGLLSTGFVRGMLRLRLLLSRLPLGFKPFIPAFGGLVVGSLALAVPGVLGVGYHLVSDALNGQMALRMMMLLLALKLIATATSYSSGNAGGIFGPSLFIGAMLGGSIGEVAHSFFPDQTGNAGAYALVGMGAVFAGIIRTPMTSVIMIFELTRDYTIIVPLMIANLCSYFLAQRLHPATMYEALSKQDGFVMPSEADRPDPLTVQRAMRPAKTRLATTTTVFPDDPMDLALQALGRSGLVELSVVNRAGGEVLGVVSQDDILATYRSLAVEVKAPQPGGVLRQNGLFTVAAITITAVLIISGIVVYQRSQRTELGAQSFESGRSLLEQGRPGEAIASLRTALAQTPRNAEIRASLGLALLQTGNTAEASGYLTQASQEIPSRGPVWMGLAQVAFNQGDTPRALRLYRQALSREWAPTEDSLRWDAEFAYATLLGQAGSVNQAVTQLLMLVQQKGDNPILAKKAADAVKDFGVPEQVQDAMLLLTKQFPADSGAWRRLGDARFSADNDPGALTAYRQAALADPANPELKQLVAQLEEILRLDPTRRGLTVRERARRWSLLLTRVLAELDKCGSPPSSGEARQLLAQRRLSLELSDSMMAASTKLWQSSPANCRQDPILTHIFAKVSD